MANKVTVTNTNNNITITPQSDTNINPTTTKTTVSITNGSTSTVTVQTPGPKGDRGLAAYNTNTDLETRNITSSGTMSSSGGFIGDVQIDFNAPNDISNDTLFRIPIVNGFTDGTYPLKSYTSGFTFRVKQPNRINGSYQTDELQIGNGSTAGGGIRLESTAGNPTYISTDGDFTLDAQTREIILSGSTNIKGSVESDSLILTSPDNTRYRVTMENGGSLLITEI